MTGGHDDTTDDESLGDDADGSRGLEGDDNEVRLSSNLPITRRETILTGVGLGGFGFLTGIGQSSAPPGGNEGNSVGISRSSLRVSLKRKIEQADEDESFRLQIHSEPSRLDDAVEAVIEAGGEVHTSYDTLIIATVPAKTVDQVANSNPIRLAGEFVQPEIGPPEIQRDIKPKIRDGDLPDEVEVPDFEAVSAQSDVGELPTSEGVEISGADELHENDVTGEGVTIAIFDGFFDVNNEKYADQVIATLGADPGDPGYEDAYENPGGHGDAVADIVASMAPDADLVLAEVFSIPDFFFFDALDAVEADHPEVDVANFSVGFLPDFRIDGLDPISLRVAAFTAETDAIFVNSAGNSAAIETAWIWIEGFGPLPIPQEFGDAYDSRGPGVFENRGRELLKFDEHFEEDLEVSTRLPLITFEDVAVNTGFIGWTIVHWDADPVADDQIYAARLYKNLETDQPLAVSRTTNPWETIDVLGEYFMDDVGVDMDVEDGAWVVTNVTGEPDVAPIGQDNPTLTLPEGQRYEIKNRASREHPLEFRDADGNPLLSQDSGTVGEFEDDDSVDWNAKGNQVEFTLTLDLAELLSHYVSSEDDEIGGAVQTELPPPIYVELQRVRATEDHHFDVWGQFGGVNVPTPWATDPRTIGIPAVSRDDDLLSAAAVQAVDLGLDEGETQIAFERNAEDLKGYSSQGPTQDGRRGIDIAGPSHVSTNARGPVEEIFGFNGTSAAAPHITGAVGLLSQIEDDTGTIRNALFDAGRGIADPDVGEPGNENTKIGFGYLDVAGAFEVLDS